MKAGSLPPFKILEGNASSFINYEIICLDNYYVLILNSSPRSSVDILPSKRIQTEANEIISL